MNAPPLRLGFRAFPGRIVAGPVECAAAGVVGVEWIRDRTPQRNVRFAGAVDATKSIRLVDRGSAATTVRLVPLASWLLVRHDDPFRRAGPRGPFTLSPGGRCRTWEKRVPQTRVRPPWRPHRRWGPTRTEEIRFGLRARAPSTLRGTGSSTESESRSPLARKAKKPRGPATPTTPMTMLSHPIQAGSIRERRMMRPVARVRTATPNGEHRSVQIVAEDVQGLRGSGVRSFGTSVRAIVVPDVRRPPAAKITAPPNAIGASREPTSVRRRRSRR